MKHLIASFAAILTCTSLVAAESNLLNVNLDYTYQRDFPEFTYIGELTPEGEIPFDGFVFFKTYYLADLNSEPLSTNPALQVISGTVSPLATKPGVSESYDDFVGSLEDRGLVKKNILPQGDSVCKLSAELKALLPAPANPEPVWYDAHPNLCGFTLVVPKNLATRVMNLLETGRGVTLDYKWQGCSVDSKNISYADLVTQIKKVLPGNQARNFAEVAYEAVRLADRLPLLANRYSKAATIHFLDLLYRTNASTFPLVSNLDGLAKESYFECGNKEFKAQLLVP